ncbi:MAG: tetratricopeptide repeat protein, partial [Cyanobacteria bacterium P01_G01_bin.39]
MIDLNSIWQSISNYLIDNKLSQYLVANKDLVRIFLTVSGVSIPSSIGLIWWYRNQKRQHRFPPATPSPFAIIPPDGDVLSVVFPRSKKDPLADAAISYQRRCPNREISVRQELIQQLENSKWLLIEGRTGLGKTREAGELAQVFSKEGWTVLWLKSAEWVDKPTTEHLNELNTNRKLLFLLDDLNQRMYFGSQRLSVRAQNSPLEPLKEPLQIRLLRTLEGYEQFCGNAEMKVIATARNEKQSDTADELSAWDKLAKDKYPQFWQRFQVYQLPEPEDEAISQLLLATIPNTNIQAEEKDYLPIARQNDSTFRNVVENLVRLRNRKIALTPDNYRDTLRANWDERYQQAVQRYPVADYIYDAVDLLRQLEVSLTKEIVQPTALIILGNQFWQLRQRYQVKQALNYLIDAEQILTPRDGQIEARDKTIEPQKYLPKLAELFSGLSEENLDLLSLYNLALNLYQYKYYEEALACVDKLINYLPQSSEISFVWLFRGNVLYDLKRYKEALDSYDQALELKPDKDEPWYNRGNVLYDLKRYKEALDSYDQALELKPDKDEPWYNRGIVLGNLKRYKEA